MAKFQVSTHNTISKNVSVAIQRGIERVVFYFPTRRDAAIFLHSLRRRVR